jgi:hypothetical protein
LADPDLGEATRDAIGAIGDFRMRTVAVAGDDAEELGRFAHFCFSLLLCCHSGMV